MKMQKKQYKQKRTLVRPGCKGVTNLIISDKFTKAKTVDFPTVFSHYIPGTEVKREKALCPFHDEKTPSFHIYMDGGHCYGCGWHGDQVAFVADLKGIRPIEAAEAILSEFGLTEARRVLSSGNHKRIKAAASKQQASQVKYRMLKKTAFLAMAEFRDLAAQVFSNERLNIPSDLLEAIHLLPLVEHWLEILAVRTEKEKLRLLREGVLERWAKLYSFQIETCSYLRKSA